MKQRILIVSPSIPQILQKSSLFKIVHRPLIHLQNLKLSLDDLTLIQTSATFLFTSAYAVRQTWEYRKHLPQTPITAYAVGKVTAEVVKNLFQTKALYIPQEETQEGIALCLEQHPPEFLLWPSSTHARSFLTQILLSSSYMHHKIPMYTPIYRKVPLHLFRIDSVFFGCPSSVIAFFKQYSPQEVLDLQMIAIGPITKNQLITQGVPNERIYTCTSSVRNG